MYNINELKNMNIVNDGIKSIHLSDNERQIKEIYDDYGNLSYKMYDNGAETIEVSCSKENEYDENGVLIRSIFTKVDMMENEEFFKEDVSYEYDENGILIHKFVITNGDEGILNSRYDYMDGMLVHEESYHDDYGIIINYEYDENRKLIFKEEKRTTKEGILTTTVDKKEFDNNSLLSEQKIVNDRVIVSRKYSYNDSEMSMSVINLLLDNQVEEVCRYDENGNIIKRYYLQDGKELTNRTEKYGYDSHNRLCHSIIGNEESVINYIDDNNIKITNTNINSGDKYICNITVVY